MPLAPCPQLSHKFAKVEYSIFLNKVRYQAEDRLVAIELDGLVRIIDSVIVLEGIALLVLEEDAGYVACGEGVMVAIGSQIASMQGGEVLLPGIYLLEELVATHALLAALAVLDRAIVANHIYIKEVLYLAQGHNGVVGKELRAVQVGILAREGEEVHVVLRFVLGIVGSQGNDAGGTRCIIVGSGIEDLIAQVAQMVVVRREDSFILRLT